MGLFPFDLCLCCLLVSFLGELCLLFIMWVAGLFTLIVNLGLRALVWVLLYDIFEFAWFAYCLVACLGLFSRLAFDFLWFVCGLIGFANDLLYLPKFTVGCAVKLF